MRAADEKFLYVMNSSAPSPPPLRPPLPSPPLHGRRVPVISGVFFSTYYCQRKSTDLPQVHFFHSPFYYLLRLIPAAASAAAWPTKLCLIGWSLDIPIPIIHCK